ncbi:MAG: rod shape-determining protein MreC [Pseudomonadota bacterium]|nr:rod shape-determining protein MreC [Pseudomonadota bacterium]
MAPPRNRRPGFSRRAQYTLFLSYVIAVAGALVGAVLLVLSRLDPPAFAALRASAAEITAPASSAVAGVGRGIAGVPDGISNYIAVHGENADLRRQIADEHAVVLKARAIAYDNLRLRALLHLRELAGNTIVTARLVSSTASSTRRFAILNAGSRQGVTRGQPVRGPIGLIGQTLETGPDTARVLLLTDPDSVVPVRRTRDGLPAIASGRGDGLLDIRGVVGMNAAFDPGDLFVTSGTGGIYPPGIPVARVLKRAQDATVATVFAQPDTLDFALVEPAFIPPAPPPLPAPPATRKP